MTLRRTAVAFVAFLVTFFVLATLAAAAGWIGSYELVILVVVAAAITAAIIRR
jgi:hypothetical protein